jgi:hypothetical protein
VRLLALFAYGRVDEGFGCFGAGGLIPACFVLPGRSGGRIAPGDGAPLGCLIEAPLFRTEFCKNLIAGQVFGG